jgi:hypothetical protein
MVNRTLKRGLVPLALGEALLLSLMPLLAHSAGYHNLTLETSLTPYMYTVKSTIGNVDTSLAIDINNGYMAYVNASCWSCDGLGMDVSYNTSASPTFYEPFMDIGEDLLVFAGLNAEGYSGAIWLGSD